MGETSGRIRELDGWRAVAVSMVVAHHFFFFQHGRVLAQHPWALSRLDLMGYLGVQVFFVISGFVICRLLLREENQYGSFSLKRFYIRRVCRILPPFYLYLVVIAVLGITRLVQTNVRDIIQSALFLMDIHFVPPTWMTGHAWSLSVEEQFYLFLPGVLRVTPRNWRRIVCGSICALCIVWAVLAIRPDAQWVVFSAAIVVGFVSIFWGVLMALYEDRARRIASEFPAWVAWALAALLLVPPFTGFEDWKSVLFQAIVVPISIAFVLLSTMERESFLRTFLCWRPVQAVGITSYSIYLWQQLFTAPHRFYSGGGRVIPYLLPVLGILIPASWILVEKPAMRFGKSLSSRRWLGASGFYR
jgi:peptidoglycan/LPS O-acetylase OafA/YrhL